MKKINLKISIDFIREACLVAGFLMLAYGIWLIYPPAMWIICGSILLWLGLPPAKPRGKGDE